MEKIIKIGFLFPNENILFFYKNVIDHFSDKNIQLHYFSNRELNFLKDYSDILFNKGNINRNIELTKFIDSVDYLIITNLNFNINRLLNYKDINRKLFPNIQAHQIFNNRVTFKQIIKYLNIKSNDFLICQNFNNFKNLIKFCEYPIVVKTIERNLEIPSICYIENENDKLGYEKCIKLAKKAPVLLEKYSFYDGFITIIVWYKNKNEIININENWAIYRNDVLLIVQPNYVQKKIKLQTNKIIHKILTKVDTLGIYTFEFIELSNMKIILNNIKVGFDNTGNHALWNYEYNQYTFFLNYIFNIKQPTFNNKIANWGALSVVGKSYLGTKNLCENNKKFIFNDFFKKNLKHPLAIHGLVLSPRKYKDRKLANLIFKEIIKFVL